MSVGKKKTNTRFILKKREGRRKRIQAISPSILLAKGEVNEEE